MISWLLERWGLLLCRLGWHGWRREQGTIVVAIYCARPKCRDRQGRVLRMEFKWPPPPPAPKRPVDLSMAGGPYAPRSTCSCESCAEYFRRNP